MSKFMSSHQLPPVGFSREQVCQLGQAAEQDPDVKPYRSFLNLSEGKVFCVLEAASSDKIAAWFKKMGMPYDAITPVELEGVAGKINDA
jgi:hypothetical protein